MGTARIHEGMRFEGFLDRQTRGEIAQEEAATLLGLACTVRDAAARSAPATPRSWPGRLSGW
jgi:hypothetical protein